jgi:hypothetical protein
MSPEPRDRAARRRDTEQRLAHDVDVWVATASAEGAVEVLEIDVLPPADGDRFAARTGFDPRGLGSSYRWFRVTPRRIQAWREVEELADRELMRAGRWLA